MDSLRRGKRRRNAFRNKKEALEWLKGVKRFDRENGLIGEVWHVYQED